MTTHLASFDLDGTLADDRGRLPHALAGRWGQYFDPEAHFGDPVLNEGLSTALEAHRREDTDVAYLTARWDSPLRSVTLEWLWNAGAPPGPLRMRLPHEQRTPAAAWKLSVLRDQLRNFDSITHYDDDPEVIDTINDADIHGLTGVLVTWYVKHDNLVGDHKADAGETR